MTVLSSEEGWARRRLLRSGVVVAAVGAAALLGIAGSAKAVPPSSPVETPAGGTVTVEVSYVGMPISVTGVRQESVALAAPATFGQLLARLVADHPQLAPMVPTMLMSVNGVAGSPGAALEDGDTVDLVPATAGG